MGQDQKEYASAIIEAGTHVAAGVSAHALLAYIDAVRDVQALKAATPPTTRLILVCRDADDELRARENAVDFMTVPHFALTRMGQIKMATLLAFSRGLLKPGDVFVFLAGVVGHGLDTVVVMAVGEEYELFQTVGQPKLTEHIRRAVFERVLRIALELAYEGREGHAVGALFVIGAHREALQLSQEGRINPFRGYSEQERNVLDEKLGETIKEIAKLDGAFIIKGNGVIVSACAILRPNVAGVELPQGLGSRHAAAAAITAATRCIAITLSQSTGDVRVWRRGKMITEIEKSPTPLHDLTPPTTPRRGIGE
jgi:DNA integrity scanning protein DisA with diadenylate cyclase activity